MGGKAYEQNKDDCQRNGRKAACYSTEVGCRPIALPIVQCPWKHSDNCEDKFREVSYTLNLNHSIGPKTSRATEVQTMRSNSVPGHIYNVDVETTNADVPYADTFFVATHYCVVKVNDEESMLTVLCDIKYKKPPWGLVKSFIDKNCWAGIEEHFAALTAGT